MDEHVVVKMGEQYPSNANDTKTVGEEISMIYTVMSEGRSGCGRGRGRGC